MSPRLLLLGCILILDLPAAFGVHSPATARAAVIDSWQVPQPLTTPPVTVHQVVTGPGIIGGYRASTLQAANAGDSNTLSIVNGILTFTVDPAATSNGFLTISWDGPPPGVGLGWVDVTGGGSARAFRLDVLAADGALILYALVVADTTSNSGEATGVIPDGSRNLQLVFPFTQFIGQSQPALVDMTRVNSVVLQLEVSPGGRVVLGPVLTAIPEPATLCVWGLVGAVVRGWVRRRRVASP